MVVLVTGANGQLGQSLRHIAPHYPEIEFVFCDSSQLDITHRAQIESVFNHYQPQFCINTAAYTAVDKAESEPEKAHHINVVGAQNLAKVCQQKAVVLLHVSTDFVFDGTKKTPYTEDDLPNPTGVYGQTKWEGEQAIIEATPRCFIIRTAWVYSQFGANFMKTMLRLADERDALRVVNDQIGTPTNAVDLAEVLVAMVRYAFQTEHPTFGIYHFSNEGQCSWYDFATAILKYSHRTTPVYPIPTTDFPTPAQRPAFSVLSKEKVKHLLGIEILDWEQRLSQLLSNPL